MNEGNEEASLGERHVERLKLALDVIRAEYEAEHSRTSAFEGRSGILLTLMSGLLVFMGGSFRLPHHGDYYALMLVMQVMSVLVAITSILAFIMVFKVRTFHRVAYESFYSESMLDDEPKEALSEAILLYRNATVETSKETRLRVKWFNTGLWLLLACLILLTITRFMSVSTGGVS